MIRNPDGSCYKPAGSLQQFDPENPDHALFNQFDQEIIRLNGIQIAYYELFVQPQTVDPLYVEDRGELWSPHPIMLYALYDPQPNQNAQGMFGIDAPDEVIFELNYRETLKTIGHPPKIGSRIFSPFRGENYTLIQNQDGEYKMWGQLRLKMICQKFQESGTTSGINPQPTVDFKLNP